MRTARLHRSPTSRQSLTASQILSILQEKPELVVELKSQWPISFNSRALRRKPIRSRMRCCVTQISTNAALRAGITVWLRARGYVSAADMDRLFRALPTKVAMTSLRYRPHFQAPRSTACPLRQGPGCERIGLPPSASRPWPTIPDRRHATKDQVSRQSDLQGRPRVSRGASPMNPRPCICPRHTICAPCATSTPRCPPDSIQLKRFGSEVFINRDELTRGGPGNRTMPVDLPIGPDYVLGTGDGLTINLWGGISQSFARVIDREGKIALPEAGSLVVAGLTLQQARSSIEGALEQQYHNAQVAVTIGRLRTVRVYVVGDVQRPGAYDISSLSTPLNALYAAGGPTSVGSLRIVRHYRGEQLIREVDLYDFLLHGVRRMTNACKPATRCWFLRPARRLRSPAMVKRPAIYELKGETQR